MKPFPDDRAFDMKLRFWFATLGLLLFTLAGLPPQPAADEEGCVGRCVRRHVDFHFPGCSQVGPFLQGERCYEVYNECLQTCGESLYGSPRVYLPSVFQLGNRWRQMQVCNPSVERIPMETVPGDTVIVSDLSGRCECLDGPMFEAPCGHAETSCDQVCSGLASF